MDTSDTAVVERAQSSQGAAAPPAGEAPAGLLLEGSRLSLGSALALAALSALLQSLAFPHPSLSGLAWVALVPFFAACRHQGPWRGALVGLVMGFFFQLDLLWFSHFFGWHALVAFALLRSAGAVLLGLSLGMVALPAPWAGLGWPLFGACAWVAMEYFQSLGPVGMTLGMLSHSQARVLPLIQVGDLVGPWGLSFVMALVNAAAAEGLLAWWLSRQARQAAFHAGPALGLGAALAAAVLVYGLVRLALPIPASGPPVPWGVVQVSVPQDRRFTQEARGRNLASLEALTRRAARQGARIILWPETSIPYPYFSGQPWLVARLEALARHLGVWLLVGSIESSPVPYSTYNSTFLIDPRRGLGERYDKMKLVGFGEYLPMAWLLRRLSAFDRVMFYVPGERYRVYDIQGQRVGVLICFESMDSVMPRLATRQGAQVLAVPTNDAWFRQTGTPMNHFEMAIMRAVENRRPVVQCGNTGISGFIDPWGRVLAETRLDERTVLVHEVSPVAVTSVYTRIGDVLAYLCVLAWALTLGRWRMRPARGVRQESGGKSS